MANPQLKLAALPLLVGLLLLSAASVQGQTTLEWITLASASEGFSVKLPVKPDEETDQRTWAGKVYKMRRYTSVDEATGLTYTVAMQEFPPVNERLDSAARLEQFMKGVKEGLNEAIAGLSDAKLNLQRDRDLDLKGHSGLQYRLSLGEIRGLVRAFDASPRMYALMVVGADEKNSHVLRFLDSFEIKPAPAPGAEPVTEPKP